MSRLKARSVDRNRLSKKYPFVRAPKHMSFFGDGNIIIELITLTFENDSSKSGVFDIPFEDTNYRVAVSPRDTGSDSANVNLYVDDDLSDASKVTIESSAPFTGVVDVIVIRIAE